MNAKGYIISAGLMVQCVSKFDRSKCMSFDKLMEQAQQLQAQMKDAQDRLIITEVDGSSGGGLVKVVMNGRHDVISIDIAPNLFKKQLTEAGNDDTALEKAKAFLESLIAAAVNDAVRKIEDKAKGEMTSLANGMELPEEMRQAFEQGQGDQDGQQ